jgi:hypothetical protein
MTLKETEKSKLLNNFFNLKVMEAVTGVPVLLLAARWYDTANFRLTSPTESGPFNINTQLWNPKTIFKALYEFPRLTEQDCKRHSEKPMNEFFTNGLIWGAEIHRVSKIALYPDMPVEAIRISLQGVSDKDAKVWEVWDELVQQVETIEALYTKVYSD